jgi:hypothetical protein
MPADPVGAFAGKPEILARQDVRVARNQGG